MSIIGSHGGKQPSDILDAKKNDIRLTGKTFWAFQSEAAPLPLVQELAKNNNVPVLLIGLAKPGMSSQEQTPYPVAEKFSADGKSWKRLSSKLNDVTGRLAPWGTALVFRRLELVQERKLDLCNYSDFYRKRPVNIKRGTSTFCARLKRAGCPCLAVKSNMRDLIAIGWLGDPYVVWLK